MTSVQRGPVALSEENTKGSDLTYILSYPEYFPLPRSLVLVTSRHRHCHPLCASLGDSRLAIHRDATAQ